MQILQLLHKKIWYVFFFPPFFKDLFIQTTYSMLCIHFYSSSKEREKTATLKSTSGTRAMLLRSSESEARNLSSEVDRQTPTSQRNGDFFFFVCTEIYIFLVFYVDDYVHVYIICICKIILVFYNIKVFFLYRGEFMPWKKSDGLERFFWTNAPRKFFRRTFQNGALVKWRLDLLGLIRIDIPYLLEWVYIYIHVSHYMLRF